MKPLPVKQLEPLDYSNEIKAIGPLTEPANTTEYLEEIGSKPSKFLGSDDWNKNKVIEDIIRPIIPLLDDYDQWKVTSTLIEDTWRTVKEKVDKAPEENHNHFKRLWSAYKAIATYILKQKPQGLTMKTYTELAKARRPYSKVGWREPAVRKFGTMGRYLKRWDVWKPRVEYFKRCLLKNRPMLCTFSTAAKRETKDKRSSRIIWCLPATARIYENRILGNLDELVRDLHYFIQGTPPGDYGERLNDIFTKDKYAVCDDISGWDTKLSLGILSLESAFIQRLTPNKGHRKQIRKLYRLYSHPMVKITRPAGRHNIPRINAKSKRFTKYIKENQDVFFKLKGQRASGSRVTYAMNTITNIAITMSRAAYSQGVCERHMTKFVLENLHKGHSYEYGGVISGDDSVIILGKKQAIDYATVGAKFMENLGMPRKGFKLNEPSIICQSLEEVEFCSRSFVQARFQNGYQRWVPVRGIGQILAKAVIMLEQCATKDAELAYARFYGLNLLLNFAHLPTIRLVAFALLSVTPRNLLYYPDGRYCYKDKPWCTKEYVLNKINRKLFGENKRYYIRSLHDLGEIEDKNLLQKYDLKESEALDKWKRNLYKRVEIMRKKQKGHEFDDWIVPMRIHIPRKNYISARDTFRDSPISINLLTTGDLSPGAQKDIIRTQAGGYAFIAAELPYYSPPEDDDDLEQAIECFNDIYELI